MLLQLQYYLKLLFWLARVIIVIFVLIPGTIPALIVTGLAYIISVVDPDQIIFSGLRHLYTTYILVIPLWIRLTGVIVIGGYLLFILIQREYQRMEDPDVIETLKIRGGKIYNQYFRIPRN